MDKDKAAKKTPSFSNALKKNAAQFPPASTRVSPAPGALQLGSTSASLPPSARSTSMAPRARGGRVGGAGIGRLGASNANVQRIKVYHPANKAANELKAAEAAKERGAAEAVNPRAPTTKLSDSMIRKEAS